MAKWKELPVTDDLKRFTPVAVLQANGYRGVMLESHNGKYVRIADVALLRLEVASLRQERDDLDRACKEWAETSQVNYQRAKEAEAERDDCMDDLEAALDQRDIADARAERAEAERDALKAKLDVLSDARKWPCYPIEMPSLFGSGPVSIADADSLEYEVWDRDLLTHASFYNLPDAINEAIRLSLARLRDEGEG